MSADDLRDLRAKVTPETACVLEAEARVTGKQQQEIVRQILHDWALSRVRAASVLRGLMQAEGLVGEQPGTQGRTRK